MYRKYLSHQIKISLQYRAATFLNMFISSLAIVSSIFSFLLIFTTFDTIAGYTLQDVLLTYSISNLVFSLSEFFFRGFDLFDKLILKGGLDVMLLRPRGLVLQILGSKVEFGKLGRVLFSLIVLLYIVFTSSIQWSVLKVITLFLMVLSGVVIFLGVFFLTSALTVFTVSGNEVANIFTHGGKELSEYPIDIYKNFFKKFFTFIVPFACFNYLPLQFLMSKPAASIWVNMLSPVYGMLFIVPCYFVFKWALKKYNSTGT